MADENIENQPQPEVREEKVETFQAEVVGAPPDKASTFAIMALILGILSFCCCGILAGIPAIVIGWLENNNIKAGKSSEKGKWMALVGLILGIISIGLSCLWIGWYFFYGGMAIMSAFHPW